MPNSLAFLFLIFTQCHLFLKYFLFTKADNVWNSCLRHIILNESKSFSRNQKASFDEITSEVNSQTKIEYISDKDKYHKSI